MRGKRFNFFSSHSLIRITPADAGKTAFACRLNGRSRDHPRRCGENELEQSKKRYDSGSPPQMRGKRQFPLPSRVKYRITPADAGKTSPKRIIRTSSQDHPRRCGENGQESESKVKQAGSPPQMRGKLYAAEGVPLKYRITPADAGKTGTSLDSVHLF